MAAAERKEQPNDSKIIDKESDCEVTEAHFPCIGKCCSSPGEAAWFQYEKICPYCEIWISLPDGASLSITTIFECGKLGFGKRIKK